MEFFKGRKKSILPAFLAASIASFSCYYLLINDLPEIHKQDLTNDGIQDIEIYNPKTKEHYAFIGQKDGSFEQADVIMQDGHPFYQTPDGHYDPWGNYFENSSLKIKKTE
jgi:hypothetical protein